MKVSELLQEKQFKFVDADWPDAEGRFVSASAEDLAAWLWKTRTKNGKKQVRAMYGATNNFVNSNSANKKYAAKMQKVRDIIAAKAAKLSEENADYLNFKGSSKKRDLKKEMSKEINRFKKMDHDDPNSYPDDWSADKKYKKELKSKGKAIPRSSYTDKYHQMFGEEAIAESNVDTALKNKSEKTGIKVATLRAVYNRGLAAWRTGHRPGVAQHQWAMGRVNSFIVGGPARKSDKDLWDNR